MNLFSPIPFFYFSNAPKSFPISLLLFLFNMLLSLFLAPYSDFCIFVFCIIEICILWHFILDEFFYFYLICQHSNLQYFSCSGFPSIFVSFPMESKNHFPIFSFYLSVLLRCHFSLLLSLISSFPFCRYSILGLSHVYHKFLGLSFPKFDFCSHDFVSDCWL